MDLFALALVLELAEWWIHSSCLSFSDGTEKTYDMDSSTEPFASMTYLRMSEAVGIDAEAVIQSSPIDRLSSFTFEPEPFGCQIVELAEHHPEIVLSNSSARSPNRKFWSSWSSVL
ncbi:uncharacterized protein BJ171DRAFT_477864 [Polychytrium aggregatum]|uniref:uncharacterized protein n=1 Tax=Polychytrium aggregatum TaxID=110093 RepID=UPI0022FEBAB1|nr:uncharacterized protein BJ171DRAFT_477864 [Polychytrium aggregatum]KAI9197517.1 hypothetical protein BJ171DRAFT_477864 [Polychytrium aggregatum]